MVIIQLFHPKDMEAVKNGKAKPLRLTAADVVGLLTKLLRQHSKQTLWSEAINQAHEIDTPEHWEKLIKSLRQQAKDNPPIMENIVGQLETALLLATYDLGYWPGE